MKVRSLQFAWFIVGLLIAGLGFLWWRAKSNKVACQMITRNVQQAMRSHQGMRNLAQGSPLDKSVLIREFLQNEPACPSGEPYQWSPVVPPIGGLMIQCTHPDHQLDPSVTKDW
jgi:hypothetical protein